MNKRLEYRIAVALNRSPRSCWADLVCHIEFNSPERWRDCRINWMCHADAQRNGSCYCGKVRK